MFSQEGLEQVWEWAPGAGGEKFFLLLSKTRISLTVEEWSNGIPGTSWAFCPSCIVLLKLQALLCP